MDGTTMTDVVTTTAAEMNLELSQKTGTLVSLYELGGYVRELPPLVYHLRKKGVNTDVHNVAHVLWPLSRENLVTFLERKQGPRRTSALTNVRITERGVEKARELLGAPVAASSVGKVHQARAKDSRGRHAVGRDMTDPSQHGSVAVGGPVERIKKENPLDGVPFVILDDEEAAKYREMPSGAPQLHKEPEVEEIKVESTTDGEIAHSGVETPPATLPAGSVEVDNTWIGVRFDPTGYPQIAAVLAKRDRIERYTKAAELLGDDEAEIAVALLEKVQITPLEAEVIRLISGD